MKKIYKFSFEIADHVAISMPVGAQILSVQAQHGVPCIWAAVLTDAPIERRRFYVRGTGHPLPDEPCRFVGTVQFEGGALVFHFFEAV